MSRYRRCAADGDRGREACGVKCAALLSSTLQRSSEYGSRARIRIQSSPLDLPAIVYLLTHVNTGGAIRGTSAQSTEYKWVHTSCVA